VRAVVEAYEEESRPTTVDDACDTYPVVNVPKPERASVDWSVDAPNMLSVPVAITLPPKNAPPCTSSLLVGEVVPIPTNPLVCKMVNAGLVRLEVEEAIAKALVVELSPTSQLVLVSPSWRLASPVPVLLPIVV